MELRPAAMRSGTTRISRRVETGRRRCFGRSARSRPARISRRVETTTRLAATAETSSSSSARISRRVETASGAFSWCRKNTLSPESQEGLKLRLWSVCVNSSRSSSPESQEGLKQEGFSRRMKGELGTAARISRRVETNCCRNSSTLNGLNSPESQEGLKRINA